MGDFVVGTKGQCFLCLGKISPVNPPISIKLEPDHLESEAVAGSTYHSIRHLARYLGMNNLREVYRNVEEIIASNLGAMKERSRLKVELCQDCANLNEVLSKQCQQLEKIELEMVPSLKQVQRKLLIADEAGRRAQQFRNDGHVDETTTSVGGVKGKCQIAQELRLEALVKCSQKLKLASPCVKLQKLTLNQLEVKCKIRAKPITKRCSGTSGSDQRSPSSPLTILVGTIKSESGQGKNEQDENEYPDVAVEVSEPSPLSPILSVPDAGSDHECELRRLGHPDDSELSTPIIMAYIKEEQEESHHEPGNNSKTEAHKTMMIGKSKQKTNVKKTIDPTFNGNSITIPAPAKVPGIAGTVPRIIDAVTGKHKCGSCSKQFRHRQTLLTHCKTVHLRVRYKCTVCGKGFSRPQYYRDHYQNVHMHVKFRCERCNKTFNQKRTLTIHQRSTHHGVRFDCELCPKTFSEVGERNRHMKRSHSILNNGKERNTSSNAVMEASSEPEPSPVSSLSLSLNIPEMGNEQECELRDAVPNEVSTPIILAHLKVEPESHHESGNSSETEASNKTSMIGKSATEVNPQKWTNFNIDDIALTIPAPIKVFGGTAKKFCSSVDPKTGKHSCGICSKQFVRNGDVKVHYQIEHLKVRYKCTVCRKEFALPKGYRGHYQNFHMHVKFRCERCNKTFNQKRALTIHQRSTHLGVRFDCELCRKTFSEVGERNRHMIRSHSILNNEKERNTSSNVVMEASAEPEPSSPVSSLSPSLNIPEMGNEQECELLDAVHNEVSTPIILAHLKVEPESHHESGNSSETEASNKTTMIGKSTTEVNPQKRTNFNIDDIALTIPKPIKLSCGTTAEKFRSSVDPNTGKHLCGSCSQQFSRHTAAWYHYQTQHLKVRYKCTVCGKEYTLPKHYREHYQNVHMHVRYNCESCNKTFTKKRSLSQHQRSAHLGIRLQCKFCPATFSTARNRKMHMKTKHTLLSEDS